MNKSSNIQWTLERIKAGFEAYHRDHGRYPTSHEIDAYHGLPSSRLIQRRFGGLPAIRTQLHHSGPQDFTKGHYSSERSRAIGARAHEIEKTVYDYLCDQFGKPFVHREFLFNDDSRNRTDFFVFCKDPAHDLVKGQNIVKNDDGGFLVDVFFPKDKHTLIGCLNSKMRTYIDAKSLTHPIIFLMMNPDIGEKEIERYVRNKKNKLPSHQHVMTFSQLKEFCGGKRAHTLT